jgi:hypothetical protein
LTERRDREQKLWHSITSEGRFAVARFWPRLDSIIRKAAAIKSGFSDLYQILEAIRVKSTSLAVLG